MLRRTESWSFPPWFPRTDVPTPGNVSTTAERHPGSRLHSAHSPTVAALSVEDRKVPQELLPFSLGPHSMAPHLRLARRLSPQKEPYKNQLSRKQFQEGKLHAGEKIP